MDNFISREIKPIKNLFRIYLAIWSKSGIFLSQQYYKLTFRYNIFFVKTFFWYPNSRDSLKPNDINAQYMGTLL